jgi:hypothetical protein
MCKHLIINPIIRTRTRLISGIHATILYHLCSWAQPMPLGHDMDLGRLHETFRYISITKFRTVSSTPWTGDQLVARTLLTAPCDSDDDGELGGMNGFGRGNRSTRRKFAPTPLCPPRIPLARPGREPGPPRWEASD